MRRGGIPSGQMPVVAEVLFIASVALARVFCATRGFIRPTRFITVPEKVRLDWVGRGTRDQARSCVVLRRAAKQGVHDFASGASWIGKNVSGTV